MSEFRVSLHAGQAAIYNSQARFKVCAAGRRFGKSHLAAYLLGIAALKHEHRGHTLSEEAGVYYVAPTFDQAKRIMWPKLKAILGYQSKGGFIINENINDGWIQVIGGRKIYIKGADNPNSLRGLGISYVVLDEYADMKSNVWNEILDPALMDYEGDALFIGTPKGKNHFYKIFMSAMEYTWDEEVDPYPLWEAFHFKSLDNPFIKETELNRIMNADDRPLEIIRQEIEASFISAGGKVLKPDWFPIIERATTNQGQIAVTVDLAGFAKVDGRKIMRSDESVIATTLVHEGGWDILNIQHGHWDTRETALRIVRTCSSNPGCRLGIERGALMNAVLPYLEDYMREFGRFFTPTPMTHGQTKKTDRIQWALQGRAERGRIRLVQGDWNQWWLDQAADFPDPLAHDDGLDAVAYVDQLVPTVYVDASDYPEWEPLDMISGY